MPRLQACVAAAHLGLIHVTADRAVAALETIKRISRDLRERPSLCHDSKTHLVSSEQPCSLLPRHGPELDVMLVICEMSDFLLN